MIVIADDILVLGKQHNHRDHDQALTNLFATATKCNVKLNYEKLQYKQEETYTTNRHKPVQSKAKAIHKMPAPNLQKASTIFHQHNKLHLQVFSKIIRACKAHKRIMQTKVPFSWDPEHQDTFKLMKRGIVIAPVLAYYNPRKQTVLQTDASINGLGACLLQDQKPVYFASKALTEAQKAYVAIELESLAVAWLMENFHHFLHASHFILETDQKPLETILSESINQATSRLQHILIRIFPYHFMVRYIPGLTNQLADCLCRLGSQKDTIKLPKLYLYQITSQLSTKSDSLNQLRVATQ